MKICILVPSEEHMKQAGVRIRYRRIDDHLRQMGDELTVRPIQDIRGRTHFVDDVYLISKCYDGRAFVTARTLKCEGKPVGIDLFDDYFSQGDDSRFTHLRYWFRTMLGLSDFVLCSTPAMRDLAKSFAPRLPAHVMNDPSPPVMAEAIRAAVRRKLEYARRTNILNLGWFGIGDNPYFPVGLADLAAFSGEIARLRGHGFDVRLEILTNQRAMTGEALAMLRRLPVAFSLAEWSEEGEAALLARSFACFLPVNAQNFSTVKSLNRAVSTLSAGTQALSAGYPLYEPLSPFVYRDATRLLEDIGAGRPALREETVEGLMRLIEGHASAAVEARRLSAFLAKRRETKTGAPISASQPIPAAVIHGRSTSGDIHKFAQRMRILSVGSPFCKEKLNFDALFAFAPDSGKLQAFVAEKHDGRLAAGVGKLLSPHGRIIDTLYRTVDVQCLVPGIEAPAALAMLGTPAGLVASYPQTMARVEAALERLFPGIECYYSERSKLPLAHRRAASH
jgi:hypothetical protein